MSNSPIQALLIEDFHFQVRMLRMQLDEAVGKQINLIWAKTLAEGLEKLEDGGVDIVILDLVLPDSAGIDTFLSVKERAGDVPIVILSAVDDDDMAVEAVAQGAQDWIPKGEAAPQQVARSLRHAVERARLKQALELSEQRYRSTVASMSDLVFIVDGEGVFREFYQSPDRKDLILKPRDFLGKRIGEIMPPYLATPFMVAVQKAYHTGESRSVEYQLTLPGTDVVKWFGAAASARKVEDGSIDGVVVVVRDITHHVKVEEELVRSERSYALAQRAANIGSWHWDLEEDTLEWSDTIEPMFGFKRGEFGKTYGAFLESVHPDDRAKLEKAVQNTLENNVEYDVEHRIIWPNGEMRWLRETGEVFRDPSAKPLRMVGIVRDVTAERTAEDALKRSREELEHFAHGAAHDLKGPLNRIRRLAGWLESESADKLEEQQVEYLTLMKEQLEQMGQNIDSILNYAQFGVIEGQAAEVDVHEIVATAWKSVDRSEDFEIKICDKLPALVTTGVQLQQVFANLLSNAVKYHDKESGRIQVTCARLEDAYQFEVSDDGPGIEDEFYDQIFEPFKTLHARRDGGGTGLGLALVKRIVENHGGTIGVESKLGEGTLRFTWKT